MFTKGQIYRRRDLHAVFGGQEQGGISTPSNHKVVFLFTAGRGKDHGYIDNWTADGVFHYTGEGQLGDMSFLRGNKAIRDHLEDGKELHLFRQTTPGFVEYIGRMECQGYHLQDGPDTEGKTRKVIVFELLLVE